MIKNLAVRFLSLFNPQRSIRRNLAVRFLLLYALFNLALLSTGCSAAWTTQASSIITLLVPAIQAAISILIAFGVGVAPEAMAAIQTWGTQAVDALTNVVKPAIDAYNNAADGAKAALLTQIKAALTSIVSNLQSALADVHVTDPKTQAKVTAIFNVILAFLTSLINLVPVLEAHAGGPSIDPEEAHVLIRAVKPSKVFKAEFNAAVEAFGDEDHDIDKYKI